jgi:glycerophosphoryl diester phosphodiesterase
MQKMFFIFFLFMHALLAAGQADVNATKKTILIDHSQPLIIGHRGGFESKLPENSISMFDFTYANACSKPIGIEFDIRESASGSLYIMHDSTVDRTTNGSGKITILSDSYIFHYFRRC